MNRTGYLSMAGLVVAGCMIAGSPALAKEKSAFPEPKGNLRYSITVTKFDNKSGWSGRWDLGGAFVEVMTAALQESGWFVVLGDKEMRQAAMEEQDFAASGRAAKGKKAAKMGRMTPAQLLVKGAITHVEDGASGKKGGLNFKGISIGGSGGQAEINMTMYLVDSETGQIKATSKVVGTSKKRGISLGYYGSALGGLTGDFDGFKKDNMGKAAEDAVCQGVNFLIEQLEGIKWEGTILKASGDTIMINRGSREGVEVGNKFTVGTEEEIVDEDTGEVLDVDVTTAGTIEVTEVKEKLATCKPLTGADAIKKGMAVHPLQ